MTDDLPRLLALVADDLAHRGYPAAGIVQQGARALATAPPPPAEGETCPDCGDPVVQPTTGRRRTYCTDRCRNRAAKRRRKASMTP